VILAGRTEARLNAAADDMRSASYRVETQLVDVSSPQSVCSLADACAARGNVTQVVLAAGVSPNMASIEKILEVDLYGTALVLEEFGRVVAANGAGLVVSSAAGHMLPALTPEQDRALASTPAEDLLNLPFLREDALIDTTTAYMMAKRANFLRVQAEAMHWGDRGARLNAISPGLIATSMGQVELESKAGDSYRATVAASPARRLAPPEEIAVAAAYLLGPDAGFVTGSDLLIDGGGVAAIRAGRVSVPR
jgi:NAD(P)-dependent dehydrogenase (short-subunit alcohol dehydrogenase family)